MTRRKIATPEFKVKELPPEYIGAVRNMDDADRIWKRIWSERPPAVRHDFAPGGWSRIRYYADKLILRGESL